jgi:hypothetical protein
MKAAAMSAPKWKLVQSGVSAVYPLSLARDAALFYAYESRGHMDEGVFWMSPTRGAGPGLFFSRVPIPELG